MPLMDKMRRFPDGTMFQIGVPDVRRSSNTKEAEMTTYDIDETHLMRACGQAVADAIRRRLHDHRGVLNGEANALRKEGVRMILKGEDEYVLPQGVQDELRRWADLLGLSLSTLADLIRQIQAGTLRATNPELAPSPQTRALQMIEASLRAAPHNRHKIRCTVTRFMFDDLPIKPRRRPMQVSEEITTRPPHPNTVPEVQAARHALQTAELAKCTAMQRHQQNWELTYSADAFASRRAKIEARRLFDDMELAALALEEAAEKYQSLYDHYLAPLKDWYRRRHQRLVDDLCESLQGEVCRKNQAVIALVDQASEDGVTLSGMTSLQELQAEHLAFTCMKLKENVGLI